MPKPNWPLDKIEFCEHLKGKKPSEIKPGMLRDITGGGKMHHCAARCWEAMVAAAKAEGVVLKPTSAGDTFRSIALQKQGFLTRYQTEPIAGASTRTYDGKKWYLKKGMAPLAAPEDHPDKCSRHMLGIAVDVANANGKILDWLVKNEQRFGFSHEVLGDANGSGAEPWHIRATKMATIPQAVLDYEATLPA